jgi:hypothetical protein
MRRYVAAVQTLTKDEEKQFIEFLRSKKILWWHWVNGFWLLVDNSEHDHQYEIRDFLHQLPNSRRGIVLDIVGNSYWAGFGPTKPENNMFKWLKSTWKPEQ